MRLFTALYLTLAFHFFHPCFLKKSKRHTQRDQLAEKQPPYYYATHNLTARRDDKVKYDSLPLYATTKRKVSQRSKECISLHKQLDLHPRLLHERSKNFTGVKRDEKFNMLLDYYQRNFCSVFVGDSVLNSYLNRVTNRDEAIDRIKILNKKDNLVNITYNTSLDVLNLTMFGIDRQDLLYEMKFPWAHYICPKSIAIDIGSRYGDSLFLLGASNKNGVTLGLEPSIEPYIGSEINLRLNPSFNIIPYNFAASETLEYSWKPFERRGNLARFVPLSTWLPRQFQLSILEKLSFIKIDVDGLDVEVVGTFQSVLKISSKVRPIFLIEWSQKKRETGFACNSKMKMGPSIWDVAKSYDYSVYDYKMKMRFNTCYDALNKYAKSNDTAKAKHTYSCSRYGLDLCDLVLVPRHIAPWKNRSKLCNKPLSGEETDRIMKMLYNNSH